MSESLTALVIDDDEQIRKLLRVILEQEHYRALESDCGWHGLSEIALRRPDVVLLDLGLPDMDGLIVLKRLRQWSHVPVLILSGTPDARRRAQEVNAAFMPKPFEVEQLEQKVEQLVDGA